MCRLVSLVLIPLLLVGQSVGLAHTHEGQGIAEPVDHAVRPHFHTHGAKGHRHHHHSHANTTANGLGRVKHHDQGNVHESPQPASWRSMDDHDEDAVYVSTAVTLGIGRRLAADESMMRSIISHDAAMTDKTWERATGYGLVLGLPPPVSLSRIPLYLRNLSLRI